MTARSTSAVTASVLIPETAADALNRVLNSNGTQEDLAALVNHYGGTDVLATIKLWANRYGAPDVRRLITDYGHTLAKYQATMC